MCMLFMSKSRVHLHLLPKQGREQVAEDLAGDQGVERYGKGPVPGDFRPVVRSCRGCSRELFRPPPRRSTAVRQLTHVAPEKCTTHNITE